MEKYAVPLIAGAAAGTTADVVLFPLDTIKTRLQSSKGFIAAGGFHRIYAGILPALLGSAPSAATFFCEMICNMVRVPFEVIKQRSQANLHLRASYIIRNVLTTEGPKGFFRGYVSTVARDVPFSFIQYPLWEFLKSSWSGWQGYPTEPWQGAVCGCIAGCTAAAITTPLDVAKTRIMLADAKGIEVKSSLPQLVISIGKTEGIKSLFSGIVPRITWIGIGGFAFLGTYDFVTYHLSAWKTHRQV